MLKINLSDSRKTPDGKNEQNQPITEIHEGEKPAQTQSQTSDTKATRKKTRRLTFTPALAAVLVIIIITIGAYLGRNYVLSLFPKTIEEPLPPPIIPSEPEPTITETEPDPVFSLLNVLSDVIPPRTWLTKVVLEYDGSYTISGMAFAYGVMASLDSGLVDIGSVNVK